MTPKLTQFDVLRICGYVIGFGSIITSNVVEAFGVSPSAATHIVTIIGFVVSAATLISNVIRNPSPPPGMVSANVPVNTEPFIKPATAPQP